PIGRREHAPSSTQLVQSAVDRGRAFELAAPHINGPGGPVGLVAGQAVALEDAGLLVGDDQHTAGPVAPANPARKPRSNASSAVEQEDELVRDGQETNPGWGASSGCVRQIERRRRSITTPPRGRKRF